eukprot:CAMPEP_0171479794 /NCGR_PEP_ID=MMETSP0946-20130122/5655_1 /TAXON_ID=109269 /ORGANISM="Vaucheria litorea, Strain CCMP2940" /LENGTH=161 /DNA_ID=CAMNT_0012010829 /DNA_START=71 /DNA_END=556 /DNA_ORIENTATION=-
MTLFSASIVGILHTINQHVSLGDSDFPSKAQKPLKVATPLDTTVSNPISFRNLDLAKEPLSLYVWSGNELSYNESPYKAMANCNTWLKLHDKYLNDHDKHEWSLYEEQKNGDFIPISVRDDAPVGSVVTVLPNTQSTYWIYLKVMAEDGVEHLMTSQLVTY